MFFQSEASERSRTPIVMTVGLAILLVLGALLYLFADAPVGVEDMDDNVRTVVENGYTSFEFSMTDSGTTGIAGEISKPVVQDYANGIVYRYHYMSVTAQRFHMFVSPGVTPNPYFVLDELGREIHSDSTSWVYDPHIDYEEQPQKMNTRYLRVYYVDPDGALILIWEHPEAEEILRRTGVQLREPEFYRLKA